MNVNLHMLAYGKETPLFVESKMPGSSLPWAKTPIPFLKESLRLLEKEEGFDPRSIDCRESIEMAILYFGLRMKKSPSFGAQMSFLLEEGAEAKNWMVTDFLPQCLKKGNAKEFHPYFVKLLAKKDVFSRRLAYVIALHFHADPEIVYVFSSIKKDDRYYLVMAEAWLLATLAIDHYEKVKSLLLSTSLTTLCKKKTIGKMIDSFQIPEEEKNKAKEIRRIIGKL